MTSTYSTNLKLNLMGTGDQSGTWGDTTNTNLGTLLEQAIVGYVTQAVTDSASPTVLTIPDGTSSNGRNYVIALTGTLTANRTVEVPAVNKPYIFFNNTSGGFSVTVKVTGQTGVTIANGKKAIVYTNSVDVIEVANAPVTEAGTQTLTNKTFVAPALGTPASATLTNATGLPISTGVSGLGTGVATFLGTPSSANLLSAMTDETGSGLLVFATSPSLTTPALSGETFSTSATVTAGTNAQGQGALTSDYNVITTAAANPSGVTLPTATTGRRIVVVNKGANAINVYPATGAAIDALASNASIQIPVAGVMIFNASSTTQWYSTYNLTLSSAGVTSFSAGTTGLTPSTATTGAVTLAGTLAVANGGTGVTTSTGTGSVVLSSSPALTTPNLGTPSAATLTNATGLPLSTGVTGTLPVANGGTGSTTLTANNVLLGNGTSALQAVAPSTSGNVLASNGTTWVSSTLASIAPGLLLRAPQIKTSGTSYTTPANCSSIYVEAVGGGGAGGAGLISNNSGGGGGSGAYCAKYFTVTASTAYTCAIGAAGGNTTFTVGATTITAGGGSNGTGGSGGSGGSGGAGGTASNGDINSGGSAGGASGIWATGQNAAGGNGGSSFFSGGGKGGAAGASSGSAAIGYGGGGGGGAGAASSSGNGGAGYQGVIRIWEFS